MNWNERKTFYHFKCLSTFSDLLAFVAIRGNWKAFEEKNGVKGKTKKIELKPSTLQKKKDSAINLVFTLKLAGYGVLVIIKHIEASRFIAL